MKQITLGKGAGATSAVLQRAIVLRGVVDLEHDARVAKRLNGRATKALLCLSGASMIMISLMIAYQYVRTEKWNMLPAAVLPLLPVLFVLLGRRALIPCVTIIAWARGIRVQWQNPIELSADAEGLRVKDSSGEVFHRWRAFGRVQFAQEIVALFGKGEKAGLPLVVLSLDWCASVADQDALVAMLQERVGPRT